MRVRFAFAVVLLLAGSVWAEGAEREAVPGAEALRSAEATVSEVYKGELAAARMPADKVKLAEKLLAAAKAEKDGAGKHALLTRAGELAAGGGAPKLAMEAVDALVEAFEVAPLPARADALAEAARGVRTPQGRMELLEVAEGLLDAALQEDRLDLAKGLAEAVSQAARLGGDPMFGRAASAFAVEVRGAEALFGEVREHVSAADVPEEMVEKVGRYRALVKGDFATAVPLLSKSEDAGLRAAAEAELKGGKAAGEEAVRLADLWWDAGAKLKGLAKKRVLGHAGTMYREALAELPAGLTRTKVEKRLAEIEEAGAGKAADGGAVVLKPGSFSVAVDTPVVIRPLKTGVKRFIETSHGFQDVPKDLEGTVFTAPATRATPTYKVTVTSDGYLYVVGGVDKKNPPAAFKTHKFELYTGKLTGGYVKEVYRASLRKGDTLELTLYEGHLVGKEIEVRK